MSIEVLTFGCRLNSYESEVMRRQAADAGRMSSPATRSSSTPAR